MENNYPNVTTENNPQPNNPTENSPQPSVTAENNYQPDNTMENNPQPNITTENNPQPSVNVGNNYQPNNSMGNNYQPNNAVGNNYQPDNTMGNNQQPNYIAIASLVCSLVGIPLIFFIYFSLPLFILGIIFGRIGMTRAEETNTGRNFAIAGFTIGIVGTILLIIIMIILIAGCSIAMQMHNSENTLQNFIQDYYN